MITGGRKRCNILKPRFLPPSRHTRGSDVILDYPGFRDFVAPPRAIICRPLCGLYIPLACVTSKSGLAVIPHDFWLMRFTYSYVCRHMCPKVSQSVIYLPACGRMPAEF